MLGEFRSLNFNEFSTVRGLTNKIDTRPGYVEKKLIRISAVYGFQILFKFKQVDLCWDDGLITKKKKAPENNQI